VADISEAQAIPRKFLEVILHQLKGSGFVVSKRGYHGGYALVPRPDRITVGDVLRFLDNRPDPFHCRACVSRCKCPFDKNGCAFSSFWRRVDSAIHDVYDDTTLQDLLDEEPAPQRG